MDKETAIALGFKPLPHFTIMDSLIYDIGRGRQLSLGSVGTPNEMMYLCEIDDEDPRKITDLVCVWNYDYDGYLSEEKLVSLIEFFNK